MSDGRVTRTLSRVAVFLGWPAWLAWRLLRPELEVDETLKKVAWARAVFGIAVSIAVLTYYGGLGLNPVTDAALEAAVASMLVTPVLVTVMVVFWARAQSGRRALLRRLIRGPGRALLIFNSATVTAYFTVPSGSPIFRAFGSGMAAGLMRPVIGLLTMWLALFAFVGAVQVYRYACMAIDAHPLLAPLLAPWFAVSALVVDLVGPSLFGDDPAVPHAVSLTIATLGALCVAALSWWEYRYVVTTYGVGARMGDPPLEINPRTNRRRWTLAPPREEDPAEQRPT